jgi:hypothetical protein
MPLPHSLFACQPLRVTSEPDRADKTNAFKWPAKKRPLTVSPKAVGVLARYSPHIDLPAQPAAMLARLGNVTTPVGAAPEFLMARRWAWLRYCWAFADPAPERGLRLSAPAFSLVEHQRQRLSEELGIATALEAAVRYLRDSGPRGAEIEVVDVEDALVAGTAASVAVRQVQGVKMRPDYFLVRTAAGQVGGVWALECKGTHAKAASLQTLYKAAAQVQGVHVALPAGSSGWASPPALIGATSFSDELIAVELLDPEGDERWRSKPAPRASRTRPQAVIELADDGTASVTDIQRFRRLLDDLAEARLLTLAGRPAAAAKRIAAWPGGAGDAVVRDSAQEHRDADLGVFDGARVRLPLGGREYVEAFIGVQRAIVTALERDEDTARQDARERWRRQIAGSLDADADALIVAREREQRITVATPDGILMDIHTAER